jgi:hypothetical protein
MQSWLQLMVSKTLNRQWEGVKWTCRIQHNDRYVGVAVAVAVATQFCCARKMLGSAIGWARTYRQEVTQNIVWYSATKRPLGNGDNDERMARRRSLGFTYMIYRIEEAEGCGWCRILMHFLHGKSVYVACSFSPACNQSYITSIASSKRVLQAEWSNASSFSFQ